MSILIKIAPDTVKKNERAGDTETTIKAGESTRYVEFETMNISEKKIKSALSERIYIVKSSHTVSNEGHLTKIKAYIMDNEISNEEITNMLRRMNADKMSININNHFETFHHDPIPDYSFEYKNTEIECNGCGSKFMDNELESDDDGYSSTVCPNCGQNDCCDIEYQSLSNFRKKVSK